MINKTLHMKCINVILSGRGFVGSLKGFGVGGVRENPSPKGVENPYRILHHPLQKYTCFKTWVCVLMDTVQVI